MLSFYFLFIYSIKGVGTINNLTSRYNGRIHVQYAVHVTYRGRGLKLRSKLFKIRFVLHQFYFM